MVDSHTQTGEKHELEGDALMLPHIPYNILKDRKQIATFAGLNRGKDAVDGELTDSLGLSTDDYPSLRPCKDDAIEQNGVTDIFEWNGNVVTIRGGILYYNNDVLSNATPHSQFAVAGNKLVILPDEIVIDLENGTCKRYRTTVTSTTSPGSVTFSENTVEATIEPKTASGIHCVMYRAVIEQNDSYTENPTVYTYGKDQDAVRDAYTDGQWNLDALEELRGCFAVGELQKIEVGDIIVPQMIPSSMSKTFSVVTGSAAVFPDKSKQNNDGYFGVVTSVGYEEMSGYSGGTFLYKNGYIEFDVFNVSETNQLFKNVFSVGDLVQISGTAAGVYDITAKIVSFDEEQNAMRLEGVSFAQYTHWRSSASHSGGFLYFAVGTSDTRMVTTERIDAFSDCAVLYEGSTHKLCVCKNHGEILSYETKTSSVSPNIKLTSYNPALNGITFSSKAPKLDYICSHHNRIYGVSNADKTLYISALGKPTDFYTYSGDADSYAVAVGSNGDFTAICSYGGGVLVFKENSLVKVFGSSPSDFYTNEYTLSGVQSGSNRSLQIVDETLYYKGVHGVYAYTGGMPSLISEKLGSGTMTDAVAGHDGLHYYVCMKDGNGEAALYVYDISRRLWMKERAVLVDSFASVSGNLLMAANGCQYTLHACDSITHDWLAEFAPFGDTMHEKKTYTTLRLRLDMQPGSKITVDVREDHAPWRTAYTQGASRGLALNVPLRIGRCSRLRVRLRGSGDVTVLSMVRELLRGSEV